MTGADLRELRRLSGWTQARLAKLVRCHERTIRRNEARGSDEISAYMLRRLQGRRAVWAFWRGAVQGGEERERYRQMGLYERPREAEVA